MNDEVRVIQDGNRLLVVEARVSVPPASLKGASLADVLKGAPVTYTAEKVGRVDDAEEEDDAAAWVQAQLDKRSRYLDRIRHFLERRGLAARPSLGGPLVELQHRKTYDALPADLAEYYAEAGIELPPAVKAAIVNEADEIVRRLVGPAPASRFIGPWTGRVQ